MKHRFLSSLILLVLLLSLVGCGILTGGDKPSDGPRGDVSLPPVSGTKTELGKSDVLENYTSIFLGDHPSEDMKNNLSEQILECEAFKVSTTTEGYAAYLSGCTANGFSLQGTGKRDEFDAAYLSQGNHVLYLMYREGEMTVILFEMQEEERIVYEWPTAEQMAYFHVNLTQPSKGELTLVRFISPETSTFDAYHELGIWLVNSSRAAYSALKAQVISAGYTALGDEQSWDGQTVYTGFLVRDGVEYFCDVRYIQDMDRVEVTLTNHTEYSVFNDGKTLFDVLPEASFIVRSDRTATEQDVIPDHKGGDTAVRPGDTITHYTLTSHSATGYLESNIESLAATGLSFEKIIERSNAFLYDYANRLTYDVINFGHQLNLREGDPMELTVRSHARGRAPAMFSHYSRAVGLTKTGKSETVAGILCTEYTGSIVVHDGDNVIEWAATFLVWEEYDLPLSYTGQRSWDDPTPYSERFERLEQSSIVDTYLSLPALGEGGPFPAEKIEAAGVALPEISGADGYYIRYDAPDGGELTESFVAVGVSASERASWILSLRELGFTVMDEWSHPYRYLANNDRLTLIANYNELESELSFFFELTPYEPILFPESGKFFYEYSTHSDAAHPQTGILEFYENGNILALGELFERIDEYHYRLNGGTLNITELRDRIGNGTPIFFDPATSPFAWGRIFKEDYLGLEADVYESADGRTRFYIYEPYHLLLCRVIGGESDVRVVSVGDASENVATLPALDEYEEKISLGMYDYLLSLYAESELAEPYRFFSDTYKSYLYTYYTGIRLEDGLRLCEMLEDAKYHAVHRKHTDWDNESYEAIERIGTVVDGNHVIEYFFYYYSSKEAEGASSANLEIVEYTLTGTAREYFGEEYDGYEYYDPSTLPDGEYSFGELGVMIDGEGNEHEAPGMGHRIVIDKNGKLVREYEDYLYEHEGQTYRGYFYNGEFYPYLSEVSSVKAYLESLFPEQLLRRYDLSSLTFVGKESVAGIECSVYEGTYVKRGQTLSLKVWYDDSGERNLRVTLDDEQGVLVSVKQVHTYEYVAFEEGSGKTNITEEQIDQILSSKVN